MPQSSDDPADSQRVHFREWAETLEGLTLDAGQKALWKRVIVRFLWTCKESGSVVCRNEARQFWKAERQGGGTGPDLSAAALAWFCSRGAEVWRCQCRMTNAE